MRKPLRCRLFGHKRRLTYVTPPDHALWIASWSACIRCGEPADA